MYLFAGSWHEECVQVVFTYPFQESPCLFFLLFMTVLQGIQLEIILILIPGVTSASALVRQLCHLNWRDGELVLLLAVLITKNKSSL